MQVQAVCAKRWQVSTRRLLRAVVAAAPSGSMTYELLTAPPLRAETFPYESLSEADIIYLRLHGLVDQPYLYGQPMFGSWMTAFSLRLFKRAEIRFKPHTKVFFEGCFAAKTGIPEAFLEAGAGEVIASVSSTYNRRLTVGPAGQVGQQVLLAWLQGGDAQSALQNALLHQTKYKMEFIALRHEVPGVTVI